VKEIRWKSWF